MKSLKLNKLKLNQLSKNQLNAIKGGDTPGYTCSCGCCYVNQGGANTTDNLIANYEGQLRTRCDKIAGVM
jgi:natural product precursor